MMKDPNEMTVKEIMVYVAAGYEVLINDGKVRLVLKGKEEEKHEGREA